jgi:hypothetical protein
VRAWARAGLVGALLLGVGLCGRAWHAPGPTATCHSGLVQEKFPVSDFYVTCATVIPVLFLAAAFQGPYYQALAEWASELRGRARLAKTPEERESADPAYVGGLYVWYLAAAILVAASAGEFFALFALFRGLESWQWQRGMVLASTLALMLVVVAGPVMSYVGTIRRKNREAAHGQPPSATSDGDQPGAS